MRRLQPTLISLLPALLLTLPVAQTPAQTPASPKSIQATRQKADALPPGAHITVIRTDAPEQFGDFTTHDADTLTFYDIDAKTSVTLHYIQIRKLKNGYGGYNSFAHRHTDRTIGWIVLGAVLVGGFFLIAAAAGS